MSVSPPRHPDLADLAQRCSEILVLRRGVPGDSALRAFAKTLPAPHRGDRDAAIAATEQEALRQVVARASQPEASSAAQAQTVLAWQATGVLTPTDRQGWAARVSEAATPEELTSAVSAVQTRALRTIVRWAFEDSFIKRLRDTWDHEVLERLRYVCTFAPEHRDRVWRALDEDGLKLAGRLAVGMAEQIKPGRMPPEHAIAGLDLMLDQLTPYHPRAQVADLMLGKLGVLCPASSLPLVEHLVVHQGVDLFVPQASNGGMSHFMQLCDNQDTVGIVTWAIATQGAAAHLEQVDDRGYTALSWASLNGYRDVSLALIAAGSDPHRSMLTTTKSAEGFRRAGGPVVTTTPYEALLDHMVPVSALEEAIATARSRTAEALGGSVPVARLRPRIRT